MYIEANICMRYTQRSKGLPSSLVPSPPTPNQKESGREPSIISQSSGIHIALENGGRLPAPPFPNQKVKRRKHTSAHGPPPGMGFPRAPRGSLVVAAGLDSITPVFVG